MKRLIMGALACLLLATSAQAQIYSTSLNWSWPASPGEGGPFTHTFDLPELIDVKSIEIEMAHTWGNDLRPVGVTGPGGATFTLLNNTLATSGSGNFDLGLVAGSGALSNVAWYKFEDAGPSQWTAPFSPAGTYNAVAWHSGSVAAGTWTLFVSDPVGGDGGAIGGFKMTYNPVPEPSSMLLCTLGLTGLGLIRRRRSVC